MEVDSWYQWLFIYAYYLGGVVLAVAGIFLFIKRKSVVALMCVLGFTGFIIGNFALKSIDTDISEAKQTGAEYSQLESQWDIFRGLSSLGFLLGAAGVLIIAVRDKNAL